jgi:hypothetical protein
MDNVFPSINALKTKGPREDQNFPECHDQHVQEWHNQAQCKVENVKWQTKYISLVMVEMSFQGANQNVEWKEMMDVQLNVMMMASYVFVVLDLY